ncbi:MAG: Gfo/Idh/MocA family oxidoreductase [Phycisphaeraceae bacterium]|nr:Gfo/Idh/MocA family oxidoreductase [Phycisphaeraceae bacterium]
MSQTRFGFVGTGMIAGVMANATDNATHARLVAVSSRNIDNAKAFIAKRRHAPSSRAEPIEGMDQLLARPDIDAIYIASPTASKEELALKSIAAGKHILVEKPFVSHASVERMTSEAAARKVLFMDATHFVHHARTAAIQASLPAQIGSPRSLHTKFCFPFSGRDNIRFDLKQEPMGMLGDLGWYSARAIVEYLRPQGAISSAATSIQIDEPSGAVIRACGMLSFASGEVSTFDVGVTTGTILMDLQLLGTTGVIGLDDFVLDWNNSWAFKNPDIPVGYSLRTGAATRKDAAFIKTPTTTPAEVQMVDSFAELAQSGDAERWAAHARASLKTQEYLDAMWAGANRNSA